MRTSPSVHIQCPFPGNIQHPFSELKEGDRLAAQIETLSGSTALLKTQDASVRAFLPFDVSLREGDRLTLLLQNRQNGQISFKLLSVNGQNVPPETTRLQQALLRLGISPTARNIHLSQLLRQNGQTPAPALLEAFDAILSKAPGLPVSVAAFMASNGLAAGEEEARFFSKSGNLPEHSGSVTQNFLYQQIPIPLEDRSQKAALFIFKNKKTPSAKNRTVIFITLQTKNMGNVEAMLQSDTDGLKVDFTLESLPVQIFCLDHLASLKEALRSTGLHLLGIHAAAKPPTVRFSKEDPIGGLDIHV